MDRKHSHAEELVMTMTRTVALKPSAIRAAASGLPSITISTDSLDSYNDRIDQASMTFRDRIPVLLAHDPKLPVGKSGRAHLTRTPHATIATWEWIEGDVDAARVRNIYEQDGFGASIGFSIDENRAQRNEHGGYDITGAHIVEFSLTPLPANADCVRLFRDLGFSAGRRSGKPECPITPNCWNVENADECPAPRCPFDDAATSGKVFLALEEEDEALTLEDARWALATYFRTDFGRDIGRAVQAAIAHGTGRIEDPDVVLHLLDEDRTTYRVDVDALKRLVHDTMQDITDRAVRGQLLALRGRAD